MWRKTPKSPGLTSTWYLSYMDLFYVCFLYMCLKLTAVKTLNMSFLTRKPVFGSVRPGMLSYTNYSLNILDISSIGIILSRERITKMLIRLCGCAGRSASLLFAQAIKRLCCDMRHMSHITRKPVYAICQQQRSRSACAFAQSDQHLCCSLSG